MRDDQLEKRRYRGMGLATLLLAGVWGGVSAGALHASMNFNPIGSSVTSALRAALILPQGWKFFTKDPQEAQLRVLALVDGEWKSAELGANAEPHNLFGLSKAPRARGAETGVLSRSIPSAAWQPCSESIEACLSHAPSSQPLHNPAPAPTLCGTLGFALQKPVPWAWAALRSHFSMPSRVAKVEVAC